jgi:hypothetical protein
MEERMNVEKADMLRIMKRQLDGSFEMLEQAIALCPQDVWDKGGDNTVPIWEYVYHALFYVNVWLKDWTKEREYPEFHVQEALALEKVTGRRISRDQMKKYLAEVTGKTESFFASAAPESLEEESENWGKRWTVADRILGQIRHVQHHVGYINAILRMKGTTTVGWIGYNE